MIYPDRLARSVKVRGGKRASAHQANTNGEHMNSAALLALGLATGLALSGCKIVMDAPDDETTIPADASGDDARTALRIEATFDAKLLPHIAENALPVSDLRAALADDFDAAGAAHANRGGGAGTAWNFAVRGEGAVVESKLNSRARWVKLDTDGDGASDLTLQLGPVVKGTALRDAAPFYNFDDFRDQIEFAKLGRAINDEISKRVSLPEGDLIGRSVAFVGVVPLKSASDGWTVTPTVVEVQP